MFSPLFINQITVPVYILFLHNSYQFVLLGQLQCLTFFFFKESLFFCSKLVSFTFTFKWTQSSPSNGAILSNGPILISNRLHPLYFTPKSYTTKSDLRRHVDSVHAGKTFSCEICKLKFTLKKNLVVHMKLHDSTSGHVCQMCGKSCQDQRSLASHLAGHSGEKNFQCTNSGCTKKYQNQSGLRKHLKVCGKSLEERQIYSCSQCPQKCVSKDVLKQHICTVHGKKGKFICQQCGYAMNSRGALKSHKCKK